MRVVSKAQTQCCIAAWWQAQTMGGARSAFCHQGCSLQPRIVVSKSGDRRYTVTAATRALSAQTRGLLARCKLRPTHTPRDRIQPAV